MNFCKVLDGGFLYDDCFNKTNLTSSGNVIGINLAGDMLDLRFNKELKYDDFIEKFTQKINLFLDNYPEIEIILIPHIYKDLRVINDILDKVYDKYTRENIGYST